MHLLCAIVIGLVVAQAGAALLVAVGAVLVRAMR
jgi:hypothetical protein